MGLVGLATIALFWNVFASSGVRRMNSHAVMWYWCVPLFSTTFMMPPPVCPYSALYMLVIMLNSCTASTIGTAPMLLLPIWPLLRGSVHEEFRGRIAAAVDAPLCDRAVVERTLPDGRAVELTPDIIAPSMNGLRAFSGISATCCVVTTPPRLALWVSSVAASAVTSTLSFTAPTSRWISTPVTFAASSVSLVLGVLLKAGGRSGHLVVARAQERDGVRSRIVRRGGRTFRCCPC